MVSVDKILCGCYSLFAFVGLVFEPLYYFGCNFSDLDRSCGDWWVPVIWRVYTFWDPLFEDLSTASARWIKVMCIIEVVLFGPLYAYMAYALSISDHKRRPKYYIPVGLLFSGALIYSTILYFVMELFYESHRANMFWVFVINCPWTFVPAVLAQRLVNLMYMKKDSKHE